MQQLPSEYIVKQITNVSTGVDASISNKTAQKQIVVVVTTGDGSGSDKIVKYNLGTLTGATAKSLTGETVVQYIYNKKSYWTTADGLIITGSAESTYRTKSEDAAKELIKNNSAVMEDLLLSAEFVKRLEAKGYDCSSYRNEIKQLYSRFENRQNYLIAYSDSNTYGDPKLLSNSLFNIVNGQAISIAVTTIIILTVVVTAAFASLAWYVFYTYGAEARSDCRKSRELNRILANVDPEVKEQLYNYIDKYADSYYKKAVARTKAANFWSNGKSLLLFAAGGALIWYINKKD